MSKTDEAYLGHAATFGETARYLEAENPNAHINELSDRHQHWVEHNEIPPLEARDCPRCDGTQYWTDRHGLAQCDMCGLYWVDPKNEKAKQLVVDGGTV